MRRDLEGFRRDFVPESGFGLPGPDDGIPTPWLPILAARTGLDMKDLERFSGPGHYVPPVGEGEDRPFLKGVARPVVCPACLRTDCDPFMRKDWRHVFAIACGRHGCRLIESDAWNPGARGCPEFEPGWLPVRRARPIDLRFQAAVDDALAGRAVDLGWVRLAGPEFFGALLALDAFLQRADPWYRRLAPKTSGRQDAWPSLPAWSDSSESPERRFPPLWKESPVRRRARLACVFGRLTRWPAHAAQAYGRRTPPDVREIRDALRRLRSEADPVPAAAARLPAALRAAMPEGACTRRVFVAAEVQRALAACVLDWAERGPEPRLEKAADRERIARVLRANMLHPGSPVTYMLRRDLRPIRFRKPSAPKGIQAAEVRVAKASPPAGRRRRDGRTAAVPEVVMPVVARTDDPLDLARAWVLANHDILMAATPERRRQLLRAGLGQLAQARKDANCAPP
jgi:hypothetical protein